MFSKRSLSLVSALLFAALAAPQRSSAQIIFATNFDTPLYISGLPLVGQDGWTAPGFLSPFAAVISTDKPRQGRQTVRVWGGDLEHQDFINEVTAGYYDAIGSFRCPPVDYDTGGTRVVRVSAHVRVDGPQTASGNNFFSASIVAVGYDGNGDSSGIGELTISSDGHVYGASNNDLVPTFLFSAPVTLGEWHELAIVDDFGARTYSFYVDGQWLGTFPFDPSTTSNLLRRATMLAYAAPDTATLKKANYNAHYDHFSIKVTGK